MLCCTCSIIGVPSSIVLRWAATSMYAYLIWAYKYHFMPKYGNFMNAPHISHPPNSPFTLVPAHSSPINTLVTVGNVDKVIIFVVLLI